MSDEDSVLSDLSGDELFDAQDESMDEADMDFPDSDSDGGSISDSGFGYSAETKGKGRASTGMHAAGSAASQVDFKVLSVEQLLKQQKEAVDYVGGMLGLKEAEAAVLLRFFGWKKEKLIEQYFANSAKTLAQAGIQEGGSQPRLKRVRGFVCDICYDDDGTKETLAMSCDHRFCKDCYSQYLTSKIMDESESRRIQCMGGKCGVIVDEKTVELLVEGATLERYRTLLNRTYVDDTSSLRWCPAPNCEYAIECSVPSRSLDTIIPSVECTCGNAFCFGCGEQNHEPCCCPIVKRWLKKCADDSETSNWISANTKECTKCHSTIEKNGGCNHMTCKKCKWEFCWVCMGPWSEHGTSWYNCARYEEKGDKNLDAQSKSRASLERYLHYYNRYANHEQSIKLEKELMSRTEKKMEAMQESSGLSWIECQFLAKAVETLSRCRNVLKWTYAMAFYLEKNNQTQMFEDNQNDLEMAVESLAEMVEKPLEEDNVKEIRQQTTDKTVYVSKRCQILLEDTLKGYEEERWIWAEPISM
ncbi:ariadne-1 [Pseudohyphozyma bogoriensis]|nr:ariadne-1 [Pseudohyphozyma bogoriensis]